MIKSVETTRGTIVIREANLADVESYRELRLFALKDSPTAFTGDYEASFNYPLNYWQNRLREDEDAVTFLAEYQGMVIGTTGIARGYSPKTKHTAGIYGVFVHPDWRGLHIAEALIETCIEWGKAKDVNIVKLGVNVENKSAIRCYQRCGFVTYGTEPRGIFYEDKYYDEYLMFKELNV